MKRILCAALLLASAAGAQNLAPRANSPGNKSLLAPLQYSIDTQLESIPRDDPFFILVSTLGVYLQGYGTVFTTQVNLANTAGISPFRQTISKEEKDRIHKKKFERLPLLRQAMREVLLTAGGQLSRMPAQENVVIAISLFYFSWEDTADLPAQIVLSVPRQQILDLQSKRVNRAQFDSLVRVQEY